MEDNKLVLLDLWASSFAMRELLEANPVHKKVPVLIHDGKSICESFVILQYIDEVWHDKSPLLPSDPYQRSQARFWGDYVEKKLYITGRRVWTGKGEDQEVAKKELIELLNTMGGELGDKHFFGGNTIGFVDVALVPFTSWFYTYETWGNFSIEAECPKLIEWAKRCLEKESVANSLPRPHKIYEYSFELKKKLGIE
ncbi:hypothetical protein QYF36_020296 [Acer negundo]|nr:hypothetical protein QYF36_020296 [Acer negundo]